MQDFISSAPKVDIIEDSLKKTYGSSHTQGKDASHV